MFRKKRPAPLPPKTIPKNNFNSNVEKRTTKTDDMILQPKTKRAPPPPPPPRPKTHRTPPPEPPSYTSEHECEDEELELRMTPNNSNKAGSDSGISSDLERSGSVRSNLSQDSLNEEDLARAKEEHEKENGDKMESVCQTLKTLTDLRDEMTTMKFEPDLKARYDSKDKRFVPPPPPEFCDGSSGQFTDSMTSSSCITSSSSMTSSSSTSASTFIDSTSSSPSSLSEPNLSHLVSAIKNAVI